MTEQSLNVLLEANSGPLSEWHSSVIEKRSWSGRSRHPVVYVVGVPRTATTYVSQKIAMELGYGYPSNLMARFWNAPMLGAALQEELEIIPSSSTESWYGQTVDVSGVHEFGRFWMQILNVPGMCWPRAITQDSVDWSILFRTLDAITEIIERPLVVKSVLLPPFMPEIMTRHQNGVCVATRRDSTDVVASLLKMRYEKFGDARHWASVKPFGFESVMHEEPETQIRWQVDQLTAVLEESLSRLGNNSTTASRTLAFSHKNLVSAPEEFLLATRRIVMDLE